MPVTRRRSPRVNINLGLLEQPTGFALAAAKSPNETWRVSPTGSQPPAGGSPPWSEPTHEPGCGRLPRRTDQAQAAPRGLDPQYGFQMLLAEEFVLLIFDTESGKRTLSFEKYGPALGAALLVELALMERISVAPQTASRRDRGRVSLTSTQPTDDTELDQALQVIKEKEGTHISSLIRDNSSTRITKGLLERLLQRQVAAGVLAQSHTEVLGLRRWPTADREPRDEIRRRLQTCLIGHQEPTERTAALVSLLRATASLSTILQPHDATTKKTIRARAKALCEGDWAGAAVKAAIDERANGMG